MRELPRVNVSEDFYMWFDLEEKKEHYATPLYLYQVKRDRINPDDETKLYLKLEKDISKVKAGKDKEVIRHPSTIYIHYVENLGAMLINFLNADFTNYETAYNTFFYAYGYELVKDYAPNDYFKNDDYIDDIHFRKSGRSRRRYVIYSISQPICKVFLPLRLYFGFFDKNCGVELETLAKMERALSGEKTSCKEGLFVI